MVASRLIWGNTTLRGVPFVTWLRKGFVLDIPKTVLVKTNLTAWILPRNLVPPGKERRNGQKDPPRIG